MIRPNRFEALAVGMLAIALATASTATAAEGPVSIAPRGKAAAGERAVADWESRRPWRYGTQYIFPLSRGLEENGVDGGWRIAALFLTVPLDLGQLPAGAVAGLFGD